MSNSSPAPRMPESRDGQTSTPPEYPSGPPADAPRYVYERVLGEGTMGTVLLARDRETGEPLAVKKLFYMDGKTVLRLKREFRSLSDMSHRNLVKVYELGHAQEGWFLAMEYIDGVPLKAHLDWDFQRYRPAATGEIANRFLQYLKERVVPTFHQLATGVYALHAAGMLHRDLKPNNVLIEDQRVVVLDFGLVRELGQAGPLMTEEGSVAGTPAYMAPEQASGTQALSEASDWYAVGTMLYESLTGQLPFVGRVHDIMCAKLEGDVRPPIALNPLVPPELNELCMALLARDPSARPRGTALVGRLRAEHVAGVRPTLITESQTMQTDSRFGSMGTPFFGRERECEALDAARTRVEHGDCAVVHVRGESGAGKSALIEHFLDDVEDRSQFQRAGGNVLVLRSRCYEREAMPFKALDSIVDALARYLVQLSDVDVGNLLPTGIDALARLFPVLQRLRAVRHLISIRPGGGNAPSRRQRAELALRELFTRLAARHTVILWVDDLQWGDLDSATILRGWLQDARELPIMLILSYRSAETQTSACLQAMLAEGATSGSTSQTTLDLTPLGGTEMRALCWHRLGDDARDHPDLVDRIVSEAAGSPFLAGQLATLAHERLKNGEAELGDISIDDLVVQISAMLPEPARDLLKVFAIAGRPTRLRHALRAAGVSKGGREHVHTLRRLQLVRSRTMGGDRYIEVYHDRIREGIAHALTVAQRKRVHGNLLKTLAYSGRADPDMLHGLALAAGEHKAALRYGLAAAERATATLAFARAAELYETCLTLDDGEPKSKKTILHKLADALAWSGRGGRAAEVYVGASELANGTDRLQLMRSATSHFLRSGHFDEGEALAARLLLEAGLHLPNTPGKLMARIAWERTRLQMRGLAYRKRSPDQVAPATLLRIDIVGSLRLDLLLIDPLRATLLLMWQVRWALDAGEPMRVLEALCGLCSKTATTGSRSAERRADALLARVDRLAAEIGSPGARALTQATRGLVYWFLGRVSDVLEPAAEAERLYRSPEASQQFGSYYICLAAASMRIGAHHYMSEIRAAEDVLTTALREAQATDNHAALLYLAMNQTTHELALGRGREAVDRLRRQREMLPRTGYGIYHALHLAAVCLTAATTHELEWGMQYLESVWPQFLRSPIRRSAMVHFLVHATRAHFLVSYHLVKAKKRGSHAPVALLLRAVRDLERSRLEDRAIPTAELCRARIAMFQADRARALSHLDNATAASHNDADRYRAQYARGLLIGGAEGARLRQECEDAQVAAGLRYPRGYLFTAFPEYLGELG